MERLLVERVSGGYTLRHDKNSAERIDFKRVVVRPLCRSVRKELKREGIAEGHGGEGWRRVSFPRPQLGINQNGNGREERKKERLDGSGG